MLSYNIDMVKYKEIIFGLLIIFFLLFSFYPTIFELSASRRLRDPAREFILEHNYYWPDYNLYLSKIRQGLEGRLTALERYTGEAHRGSFVQIFYLFLGQTGRLFQLSPNYAYLLGRIILSPLLLVVIILLVNHYFKNIIWQMISLIVILSSGSFPRFYTDPTGALQIGRFMEWWSNIDAIQRITFIPHIMFGQVVSLYLLYKLTMKSNNATRRTGRQAMKQLILFIMLGNAVGLVFPPSLITLDGVILLTLLIQIVKSKIKNQRSYSSVKLKALNFELGFDFYTLRFALFIISTLPSLLYLFFITKILPWSALVIFHRTHPMMIPFWDYILGTGPIFFLGLAGAVWSVLKRDRQYQPIIFWVMVTFFFAVIFTHLKDQSPLRFTQTGLFIPLGLLTSYFFYQLFHLSDLSNLSHLGKSALKTIVIFSICFYLLLNFFMMKVSLNWQISFISQRLGANVPAVPYPPQTMYPLTKWMEGIRWLEKNTQKNDVVLAQITAGNFIPAYSGNTVYFGQSNTVDYDNKQERLVRFFSGKMTSVEAKKFLDQGRIKYIFYSVQEKELLPDQSITDQYLFLNKIFNNDIVQIFRP